MSGICNDNKIYFKSRDWTIAYYLTINYSFPEKKAKLLGNSGLIIPSTETIFSAVQKYGTKY